MTFFVYMLQSYEVCGDHRVKALIDAVDDRGDLRAGVLPISWSAEV